MIAVLLIAVLGVLMNAARDFAPTGTAALTTLGCGYLLLTAFFAGSLFKRLGLPRLTGYLTSGIVVGPEVLGLLTGEMVGQLRIFNGVAVALIALTAGIEIDLKAMRPLMRSIAWISLVAVLGTVVLLFFLLLALSGLLGFMEPLNGAQTIATAAVLAVAMVAQSPAVVVALRDETRAEGPLMRTVLGVVIIADILVIFLFAIVSALARSTFGGDADVMHTIKTLAWEIGGSGLTGAGVGLLLAAYLRRSNEGGSLFVVAVAFLIAEIGQRVHFDPLLVALSAGIVIRNATTVAVRVHHLIEAASLPVYVIFFAVAGATIHVHALISLGLPAMLIVLTRGSGFFFGTRYAARRSDSPDVVARLGGYGLMPQAGLALALALILSRAFPELGGEAATLVFGVVAINELVAPILFRRALVKSGEAATLRDTETPPPEVATTPVAEEASE